MAGYGGATVAVGSQLGYPAKHVPVLLVGDGDLVLGERAGYFLQCQAVLARLDELMRQLRLLTA
jgi:hypothetical protein